MRLNKPVWRKIIGDICLLSSIIRLTYHNSALLSRINSKINSRIIPVSYIIRPEAIMLESVWCNLQAETTEG